LRLYLAVDQDPLLDIVLAPDLHELIDVAPAGLRVGHQLLELLVERLVAARPVDLRMNLREQQRQERLEVEVQRLLPRAVVIGRHDRAPPRAPSLADSAPAASANRLAAPRGAS